MKARPIPLYLLCPVFLLGNNYPTSITKIARASDFGDAGTRLASLGGVSPVFYTYNLITFISNSWFEYPRLF